MLTVDHVASICHEANRQYCQTHGDLSQPAWADAPDWQRLSAVNGVRFHLGRLREGLPASPEASHENWLREKVEHGWTFGPVKNPDLKQHPCCVPYASLPPEQQAKDAVFVAIVHALAPYLP